MFNVPLLQEQIDAAGIPNEGVDSEGNVYYLPEATEPQRQQGAAIVAAHNPAELSQGQILEQARAALEQGRVYFRNQLVSSTPHTPAVMVGNIKPIIDGNAKLLQAMTNQLTVVNGAFGWTLTLNPGNTTDYRRYLITCQLIFGTVADAT
jgi:hypothetical protein